MGFNVSLTLLSLGAPRLTSEIEPVFQTLKFGSRFLQRTIPFPKRRRCPLTTIFRPSVRLFTNVRPWERASSEARGTHGERRGAHRNRNQNHGAASRASHTSRNSPVHAARDQINPLRTSHAAPTSVPMRPPAISPHADLEPTYTPLGRCC